MPVSKFRKRTWAETKGQRINKEFITFGVNASYIDEESQAYISLRFNDATADQPIAEASCLFAHELMKVTDDEQRAIDLFTIADMSCFS